MGIDRVPTKPTLPPPVEHRTEARPRPETSTATPAPPPADPIDALDATKQTLVSQTRGQDGQSLGGLKKPGKPVAKLVGVGAGLTAATLSQTTGAATWVHEVAGHVYLGGGLTSEYPDGITPTYQVDGIDNFKAIGDASTPGEKLQAIGRWVSGYDAGQDGRGGWARSTAGASGPNELGQKMGEDGRRAWISLTGSLPALCINSLGVLGGMKLKEEHPAAGYALLGFGMASHAMASGYPISAALMSNEKLIHTAENSGHDFANFAVRMSNVTGLPPRAIAISTAAAYTGLVPAVAVGMYLYQKSHRTDVVPDGFGLAQWLSKSTEDPKIDKRFTELLTRYPGRRKMEATTRRLVEVTYAAHKTPEKVSKQDLENAHRAFMSQKKRFDAYLLEKIDPKDLKRAKQEVLNEWKELQKSDKLQVLLDKLSVGSMVVTAATPVVTTLGRTVAPALGVAGTVLTFAAPVLSAVHTVRSAYETHKDLEAPDSKVPKKAKRLSVAHTAMSAAGLVALTASVLAPPTAIVAVPAFFALTFGGVGVGIAKNRIIAKTFNETHGYKPKPGLIRRAGGKIKQALIQVKEKLQRTPEPEPAPG